MQVMREAQVRPVVNATASRRDGLRKDNAVGFQPPWQLGDTVYPLTEEHWDAVLAVCKNNPVAALDGLRGNDRNEQVVRRLEKQYKPQEAAVHCFVNRLSRVVRPSDTQGSETFNLAQRACAALEN